MMLYVDTTQRPTTGVYVDVLSPIGVTRAIAASSSVDSPRADIHPGRVHAATTITGGPAR